MGITEHRTIDTLLKALGKKGADDFNLYIELLDLLGYETADKTHKFYSKHLEEYNLASRIPGKDGHFNLTKKGCRILESGGWLRELLREKKEDERIEQKRRLERVVQVCLNKQITKENLQRTVEECMNKVQESVNTESVDAGSQNMPYTLVKETPNWGQMKSTIAMTLSIVAFIISLLAIIK